MSRTQDRGGGKGVRKRGYTCGVKLASVGLAYKGLPIRGGYIVT